jgi:hypothetical protein
MPNTTTNDDQEDHPMKDDYSSEVNIAEIEADNGDAFEVSQA